MESQNISTLLYLASGVLFIIALRGLSSPDTSRRGNYFGMAGMVIAVATTLALLDSQGSDVWFTIVAGIAIGGVIGAAIARRIAMTDMPQLVAAFHSLVGLAAVMVAWAAFLSPEAFNVSENGVIKTASLIEMSLGVAIGAITFSGSVIAFAKLQGTMSGAPILLPQRHAINLVIALAIVAGIVYLVAGAPNAYDAGSFPVHYGFVFRHRVLDNYSDWWGGYARGCLHAEFLFGLGGGRHRLYAVQSGADHHRLAGRLFRCNPVLYYVQRHEPFIYLRHPRWFRGR